MSITGGKTGKMNVPWRPEENQIFTRWFEDYIISKTTPPAGLYKTAADELPGRRVLAIRTRLNNIQMGKQQFPFCK